MLQHIFTKESCCIEYII